MASLTIDVADTGFEHRWHESTNTSNTLSSSPIASFGEEMFRTFPLLLNGDLLDIEMVPCTDNDTDNKLSLPSDSFPSSSKVTSMNTEQYESSDSKELLIAPPHPSFPSTYNDSSLLYYSHYHHPYYSMASPYTSYYTATTTVAPPQTNGTHSRYNCPNRNIYPYYCSYCEWPVAYQTPSY